MGVTETSRHGELVRRWARQEPPAGVSMGMDVQGVLGARLRPPRLPPGCVDRPGLVQAVLRGNDERLVAVVAGAGYGKTVLLVQALRASPLPWVWCSCDARVSDARLLLAHLVAGIAERFPGFGAGLRHDGGVDEQIGEISNEVLETVSEDFVVAFDDVHLLPDGAAGALEPLVDHLPASVHFVVAARAPLPLSMARLRGLRAVEVGESQLAFTPAEAEQLVRSLGTVPPAADMDAIHSRTEGWAAGLILAAQSTGASGGGLNGGVEFDYLAEEVFLQQPGEMRELLLDTFWDEETCGRRRHGAENRAASGFVGRFSGGSRPVLRGSEGPLRPDTPAGVARFTAPR